MTSPLFGLVRKKDYGNVDAPDYLDWFRPFAREIFRVLAPSGSFVLDIGGAWNPSLPTRSLYHFKLLIMLCEEFGFHLAQVFFWWSPSKLPSPAEWVTVRRVRVTGAESEGPNDVVFAPPGFPNGLNAGAFIGFHGRFDLGGTSNEENPLVFANPNTGAYYHFN